VFATSMYAINSFIYWMVLGQLWPQRAGDLKEKPYPMYGAEHTAIYDARLNTKAVDRALQAQADRLCGRV
jgi:hypothetical protein